MEDHLKLILVFVPLVAGAIAIFFALRLMRIYKLAFVSSYFYYLVFLYIFGVYSLVGSGALEHFFMRMETGLDIIHSTRLFAILVGIPLLILSKYMLLKSITELFSKKLWPSFTLVYFLLSLISFGVYGVFVVRLTKFESGEYQALVTVQRWVFTSFLVFIYGMVYLISMVLSRRLVHHERSFARTFASWYLLFGIISSATFILSGLHEIIPFIFIFFFLSWHLIPILFLYLYLEKYHGETAAVQDNFEEMLVLFSDKYEISKREREVIHLICKGLSNQEISDALFISLQTVKDHIHRIFVKTGVKNRVQLSNLIRTE